MSWTDHHFQQSSDSRFFIAVCLTAVKVLHMHGKVWVAPLPIAVYRQGLVQSPNPVRSFLNATPAREHETPLYSQSLSGHPQSIPNIRLPDTICCIQRRILSISSRGKPDLDLTINGPWSSTQPLSASVFVGCIIVRGPLQLSRASHHYRFLSCVTADPAWERRWAQGGRAPVSGQWWREVNG